MFNKKSEYALNKKDASAIIYTDALGNRIRLTADDFGSVKEFRKWKNWSDMKNHSDEKKDHVHRNHTMSLSLIEEVVGTMPDTEHRMIQTEDRADQFRQTAAMLELMKDCLSETQYRRVWLYYVEKLNTHAIATLEGVTHQSISESLESARIKILKHIKK